MYRIFYFNINFICNNSCVFCFSHNTYKKYNYEIKSDNIHFIIDKFNINNEDRVIINGGEPTLSKDIFLILDKLKKRNAHIIFFSNGRKLKNKEFCNRLLKLIDRIVIPIHGTEVIHEKITRKKNSYKDTILAIKNIKEYSENKLELKFIVTKEMVDSNFSILNFLKEYDIHPTVISITGMVKTKISALFINSNLSDSELGSYISRNLQELLRILSIPIKLFDIPICHLEDKIIELIEKLPIQEEAVSDYVYYYFDEKHLDGVLVQYNNEKSESKCVNCRHKIFCRSITESCKVLEVTKYYKKIVLE